MNAVSGDLGVGTMAELDAERTAAARRRAATRTQRTSEARLRLLTLPAMILADVLALTLAVGIAFAVRQVVLPPAGDLRENVASASLIMALGWLAVIAVLGGYDRRQLTSGPQLYRNVLHASGAAFGVIGALVYLLDLELSRAFFLAFFAAGPPLLLLNRVLIRRGLATARVRGSSGSR
ncbi:hypothetical protein [Brachybacterium sp. Z12]|uniref:hypothetical protein n=1 Tax=Brachybacterium sp. Z12 TaxID=2759167 RepID=UPI00223BA23C|nr:hypothetical protein [Brachybacterium sp. Z12]